MATADHGRDSKNLPLSGGFPQKICDSGPVSDATGVEAAPSVLLSFRAENARSFRDPLELSLLPTAMAESEVVREVPWREGGSPIGVLPVAGVLGANASGKSNMLRIMDDMRRLVLTSFRLGVPTGGIERHPFRLDGTSALPTRFEVDLIVEGIRYEYGFSFDDDRVLTEWAFYFPKGRAKLLFERNGDDVDFGSEARRSSRAAFDLLRPNALFLSTAASANHPALLPLFEWFHRNLLLAEVDTRNPRQAFTAQMLDDPKRQEGVLALLRAADLGITGAIRHEIDPKVKERVAKAMRVLAGETDDAESDDDIELGTLVTLTHRSADGQVPFGPAEESLGTLVWFGLVGPVLDALEKGAVLLADELDASLHPALVRHLVRLFQDQSTNPRRAQLIFNSHDATLLDADAQPLGRDQVWLAEKTNDGATSLYSLADLKPRKHEAIEKRYLEGRYGGVPIVSWPEFAAAAELVTGTK